MLATVRAAGWLCRREMAGNRCVTSPVRGGLNRRTAGKDQHLIFIYRDSLTTRGARTGSACADALSLPVLKDEVSRAIRMNTLPLSFSNCRGVVLSLSMEKFYESKVICICHSGDASRSDGC
ncbi:hypothetical protein THII_3713 [Thioploca ingrica]|uniref:Uncharacterized protein n=1 Tax=Thioploca ingrica TaxID=40754 RepID=A0A090AQQ6_9GAMM|nr:hypothetical protein THII_3713 [Thioploca ingrica]